MDNKIYGVPKDDLWWNIADELGRKRAIKEFTEWSRSIIVPLVNSYKKDRDEFVKRVVYEGFTPELGNYYTDIDFVLQFGSRELAKVAALKYYESLDKEIKEEFWENYKSMIEGGTAVTKYGSNLMLNRSNFKTIIEYG